MNKKEVLILVFVLLSLLIFFQYKLYSYKFINLKSHNIFFIETNTIKYSFDSRELCAIESAAFNNPEFTIYVKSLRASCGSEIFLKYNNIKCEIINLEKVFNTFNLSSLYKNGSILESKYKVAHISDILRVLMLYRYGGFYSDLDTITIKNLQKIIKYSGVGYLYGGKGPTIGNGILIFRKNHRLLKLVIEEFRITYDPQEWNANGPLLFIKMIKKYCNTSNIFNELNCDMRIFPKNYFYRYSYRELDKLLKDVANVNDFNETYSIHFYGKLSSEYTNIKNNNNVYNTFAKLNCPETYKLFEDFNISNGHF